MLSLSEETVDLLEEYTSEGRVEAYQELMPEGYENGLGEIMDVKSGSEKWLHDHGPSDLQPNELKRAYAEGGLERALQAVETGVNSVEESAVNYVMGLHFENSLDELDI